MKRILIFIPLLFLSLMLIAQYSNKQNIRGRVLDAETHQPLPGAYVKILNSKPTKISVSDENGEFHFWDMPIGHYGLSASYTGYESQVVSDLYLESSKEAKVDFFLEQLEIGLGEVIVIPKNKKAEPLNPAALVSTIQFSVEETSKFSGSLNDPARMVSAFPGITASHDASNEIIVRGNSPLGLQWRIEDVEIPNPNHFSDLGSTGGAISMLSNFMMGNSDFLSGNFPAEYGNATSGIFDIHLRNGNDIYRNASLKAGVIGLDASSEGPIRLGNGGSYIINYRYSTLAILKAMGINIIGDATPNFQDMAFKVNIPLEKKGTIAIWGLGGISNLNETLSNIKHEYGYDMFTTGLNYKIWLNTKNLINFSSAISYSNNKYSLKLLPQENIPEVLDVYNYSVVKETLRSNLSFTQKLKSSLTLKSGVNLGITPYSFDVNKIDTLYTGQDFNLDNKGTSVEARAYTSLRWSFASNWTSHIGAHALYYTVNNKYSIEPRFGIKWQFQPRHSFAFGFGHFSRNENVMQYFVRDIDTEGNTYYPDKNLDFIHSEQTNFSYTYNISTNLFFRTEIYYQRLSNVPVKDELGSHISLLNSSFGVLTEPLVNKGLGENKGIELMLQKFYSYGTFHLISFSLFDSKYQGNNSAWYNTAFNNKFALQVISGREINITKNKLIGFSARMHWFGGRRYTPIDLEKSRERGYAAYEENNIYGAQTADYFRIDFQFRYVFNHPKFTSEWKLDIQNLTNKLNLYGIHYNSYAGEIENTYQTGLVPVITYSISFNRN